MELEKKVFVSSKMSTREQLIIREAAREAISEAGFLPVIFDDQSARPFEQYENSARNPCVEAVKHADLFMIIIEDKLSTGMKAEYITAKTYLGSKKIFYFFRTAGRRNLEMQEIRNYMLKEGSLKEFTEPDEIKELLRYTLKEYLQNKKKNGPDIIYEEALDINPGTERHLFWSFDAGDNIYITVVSDGNIYAEFIDIKEYKLRKKLSEDGIFKFVFEKERPSYVFTKEVPEPETYYLVLRSSLWGETKTVNVRVVSQVPMKLEFALKSI
jgi:hypothetical protein